MTIQPDELHELALDYLAAVLRGEKFEEETVDTEYSDTGSFRRKRRPVKVPAKVLSDAYKVHCSNPGNRDDADIIVRVV